MRQRKTAVAVVEAEQSGENPGAPFYEGVIGDEHDAEVAYDVRDDDDMQALYEPAADPPDPDEDAEGEGAGELPAELLDVLRDRFGLLGFRGRQEEACTAVVDGRDALIVMPTGAGKSLCYQLPAIVRQGCAVVVSPLIALMEDQVIKLQALGVRAERIHSGRAREESRRVCRDYLDGKLELLYVSPERLSAPRFSGFLGRKPPSLIAVDEAHCISQWGHDFRPAYRGLAHHIELAGRPPVVALTATATHRVQDDIVEQLRLTGEQRVVHGFARDNLGIEAVDVPPSERAERIRDVLKAKERRPAIVYVPTRRAAEETASTLSRDYPAGAYHAGMPTSARDEVQASFQSGAIDVVVATSAFGMGIDKQDVRTVVHGALPSSIEAYYQEIGRAGRDGEPARVVLLWSFADKKLQERLFERSYPEVAVLRRVRQALGPGWAPLEELASRVRMDADSAQRAVEQLSVHGGAVRDSYTGEVRAGPEDEWAPEYERQRALRAGELDEVAVFATGSGCRMTTVVEHFGDRVSASCGICDACDPMLAVARNFRRPTDEEIGVLARVLEVVRALGDVAKGKLFTALESDGSSLDRRALDRALAALDGGGMLFSERRSFEKNGETITYTRVRLTADGEAADDLALGKLWLDGGLAATPRSRSRVRQRSGGNTGSGRGGKTGSDGAARGRSLDEIVAEESDLDPALIERLRAWRRDEAQARGVPAYRVLTNRSLTELARARPDTAAGLGDVHGIGPAFLKRHADDVLKVLQDA